MNTHLKGIVLNIAHVLSKFVFQHSGFLILRDKEQIPYVVPYDPSIEKSGAFINVFVDELGEVVHILLGSVICLNDRVAPLFKLFDIVLIVPIKGSEVFQVIVHSVVRFFEVLQECSAELAQISYHGSFTVCIELVEGVLALGKVQL